MDVKKKRLRGGGGCSGERRTRGVVSGVRGKGGKDKKKKPVLCGYTEKRGNLVLPRGREREVLCNEHNVGERARGGRSRDAKHI